MPSPPFHPAFSPALFSSFRPGGRSGRDTGLMNERCDLWPWKREKEGGMEGERERRGGMDRVRGVGSLCRRSVT